MPSVLIVDDLVSIHGMLEAVIQPTGFSSAFATDGDVLWRTIAHRKGGRYALIATMPFDPRLN